MATNSGRGNASTSSASSPTRPLFHHFICLLPLRPSLLFHTVASEDNPPTPDLHPPPLSSDFKKEVAEAEPGPMDGKRAAGHDVSSSLPATSVATGEQAEKVIRTAADIGGK
ncbi:hypothetical protein GE09DRAFT_1279250 [Coniochaeta sp. 2T2.1]|nr:hypothetical protein GE09DRAFT_1279250 [Coniochaeta sp. 2T2.1]